MTKSMNGTDKMPEQSVLRLSDTYESKSEEQSRGVKGEHI